jgi:2,4-dienoyl-CoA reductase-like NADH-dependent reductase (Old Yellow Enzyme family)/thioredoxin reductase
MKYPNLFKPIKINTLMVKNRIIATPTFPIKGSYYEKACGGAGIVIASSISVEPGRSSWMSADEEYAFSKYEIANMKERVLSVQAGGARASIELGHAGQYARVHDYAVGPTGFIREDGIEVKEMTEEMMDETASWYARTAVDARDCGFDMIFMHFGHGWLADEFLSPLFNKRTDQYGGSIENRIRFPKMILERVRKAVGPDYPIDMRVSAIEWVEGGIKFEDVLTFIKSVEHLIDTVHISCGLDINHEGNVHTSTTTFEEHMPNVKYAKIVKQNVKIPVSVVGAIINPDEAENLIASGDVDMVALGRPLVADPEWPKKALEGRPEDIVPCIRCLQCYHISTNRKNVACSVNPRYYNESWYPLKVEKAEKRKRVVIIGAGPAGIRAALTADYRGHDVILLEKSAHVGGAIHYVAMEKYKIDVKAYLEYLKAQLEKSSVDLRLETAATPEIVRGLQPDTLMIAIGADPVFPPINGICNKNVIGFYEAIENNKSIGQNVVIIGGGTIGAEIGLELAVFDQKNVSIVEMSGEIASQGNMLYKIGLRQHMDAAANLTVYTKMSCMEISDNGVVVKDKDSKIKVLPADTVIIATGVKAKKEDAEKFYGITPDTYTIGDCEKARIIKDATFEGCSIALTI